MNAIRWLAIAILGAIFIDPVSAADLGTRSVYKAPPPLAPVYDWQGFYIGAHVGYGWARPEVTPFVGGPVTNTPRPEGVLGGGQIGFNFQTGAWVYGIEADASYGNLDDTRTCASVLTGATISCRGAPKYFGTLDGRLGFAVNNWLPYIKGGAAWSHEDFTQLFPAGGNVCVGTPCTGGVNQWGWTVGGGVEYGFANHWSLKVEYDFLDFSHSDTVTISNGASSNTFNITKTIQKAEVGLNYRFDLGRL